MVLDFLCTLAVAVWMIESCVSRFVREHGYGHRLPCQKESNAFKEGSMSQTSVILLLSMLLFSFAFPSPIPSFPRSLVRPRGLRFYQNQDLTSVQNLQKKHALLEADIASHQDRIDGVKIQCQQFQDAGHFDAENIAKKTDNLVARYSTLQVRWMLNLRLI